MQLCHESDKVWIKGVHLPDTCQQCASTYAGLAVMLEAAGETSSYEDLACYSGFSFRLGVHQDLCPSAAHPACGYMCYKLGYQAMPRKASIYHAFPWQPRSDEERLKFEEEVRQAIVASIDRGIPVLYGSEEDGLIVGYADSGRRWLCRHQYHKCGEAEFWFDEAEGFAACNGVWPWGIVILGEEKAKGELPKQADLLKATLEHLIAMYHSDTKFEDVYFCGDAAWAYWLEWLANVDRGVIQPSAAALQGNRWCYVVLTQERKKAVGWLREQAIEMPEVSGQLNSAADAYQRLVDCCLAGIGEPWKLCPGPNEAEEWTTAQRNAQMNRLSAAREQEANAVQSLQDALAKL